MQHFFFSIVCCHKVWRFTIRALSLCQFATAETKEGWPQDDKMFPVGKLEFCLSRQLLGWAASFFIRSTNEPGMRPPRPQLCAGLKATSKEDRHRHLLADFGLLQHKRFILNATSNHFQHPSFPLIYHIIFKYFLTECTKSFFSEQLYSVVSLSLTLLRMAKLPHPNCYTEGCEFILLNYGLVYLVSLFYIKHLFKWFSLY